MAYISVDDGTLTVPDNVTIPVIPGDGIGPEVWAATRRVINTAISRVYGDSRSIIWEEITAGESSFKENGEWLPASTVAVIKAALVTLKGPLTTPVGEGVRSINVTLRQSLDLYACVRPVRYYPGVPSPVKQPEKTDLVIFRENTEDVYSGIEFASGSPESAHLIKFLQDSLGVTAIRFPLSSAIGIKPISCEGSTRLIDSAIRYAIDHGRKNVTFIHKGNIMKFTEGGFRAWGYDLAESTYADRTFTWRHYTQIVKESGEKAAKIALADARAAGKIIVNDVIADNFLQQGLLHPENFDVVATTNLNGDYISDALAAQVGGIGISPGANINYETGRAIFEATHGTAPDVAGKGVANPCSMILSACLMLDHIGWNEAAAVTDAAVAACLAAGKVTSDFASLVPGITALSTNEFTDALVDQITHSL